MARRFDITTGIQTVTAAGAVTGTLDTSAITGNFTLHLRVWSLSAISGVASAMIALQDTANASAFSDAVTVVQVPLRGTVGTEQAWCFRHYETPNARFGSTNTKFRVNVLSLTGGSPQLKLEAWLEQ